MSEPEIVTDTVVRTQAETGFDRVQGSHSTGENAAHMGLHGLQVRLHWSWFIILALLTWGLAIAYYPSASPGWGRMADWIAGSATSLLFFTSVLVHEMAHSLVARYLGLPVRRITLFVFGGVSELGSEPNAPSQEFWMTVAGPATSFALGALFALIWVTAAGAGLAGVSIVAGYLAGVNVAVGIFNLLPGFPLDGGRILRSLIWRHLHSQLEATRIASTVGRVVAALLAGAGILLLFGGQLVNGVWFLLIAWFLDNAASSSYGQLRVARALRGLSIVPLLDDDVPWIPPDVSLHEFVESTILAQHQRAGFVGRGLREIEGLISISDVRRVPRQQWGATAVAQAMTPRNRLVTITRSTSAETALELMNARRVSQLPCLFPGQPPQLLTRAALLRALSNRLELGNEFPSAAVERAEER